MWRGEQGHYSIICDWNWLLQFLSVGRGEQRPAVLSMFGTGFYSCYLCGEGSRGTTVLSVIGTGFYSFYLWGEGSSSLQYYPCLELAFTVVGVVGNVRTPRIMWLTFCMYV